MKVRIFDKPPEPSEKKQEIFLTLRKDEDGIILMVVDQDGVETDAGNLLSINNDGTMTLFEGVDKDSGLCITKAGYLRVKRK